MRRLQICLLVVLLLILARGILTLVDLWGSLVLTVRVEHSPWSGGSLSHDLDAVNRYLHRLFYFVLLVSRGLHNACFFWAWLVRVGGYVQVFAGLELNLELKPLFDRLLLLFNLHFLLRSLESLLLIHIRRLLSREWFWTDSYSFPRVRAHVKEWRVADFNLRVPPERHHLVCTLLKRGTWVVIVWRGLRLIIGLFVALDRRWSVSEVMLVDCVIWTAFEEELILRVKSCLKHILVVNCVCLSVACIH